MSFDPVRQEELRIMGYKAVIPEQGYERQMMGRIVTVAGPVDTSDGRQEAKVDDVLIENEVGEIALVPEQRWTESGWVLIDLGNPDPPSDEPVQLAEPVGLLQRDETTTEEPHDV